MGGGGGRQNEPTQVLGREEVPARLCRGRKAHQVRTGTNTGKGTRLPVMGGAGSRFAASVCRWPRAALEPPPRGG